MKKISENAKVTLTLGQLKKLVEESSNGKEENQVVENDKDLIDQVLEDPNVRAASEQFVNCIVKDIAQYKEFKFSLKEYITKGDEHRFSKLKEAIMKVVDNYSGPR